MGQPLKILFLSAEVAPYAKTGGLGDVGGSLPKALRKLGHDVRVMMPAYQAIEAGYPGVSPMPLEIRVSTGSGTISAGAFEGRLPNSDVPIYFIAQSDLFNRPNIYGYWDDPYRFAFFSKAALAMTGNLSWVPDVVHAHDWHSAPAITWLATAGQYDPRLHHMPTVFTIHNLAHQGRTSWSLMNYMQIVTSSLVEEPYGEINFMARGIYHATMVNTVSPTYAQEIMTHQGGAGLDGLLRHRAYDVHGILNGLDTDVWNPATDKGIKQTFTARSLGRRLENRHALQEMAGLAKVDGVPLVAMVSRLDGQKGLDITGNVIHRLLSGYAGEAQFVILGTGDPQYEAMFARMAYYHPTKMAAYLDYNAALAKPIYAASDMFIMPSLFEPCGLGQMIAMRYGSVPVVRATGGLVDTVQEGHTGFMFHNYDSDAFWGALQRAISVYTSDKDAWKHIQQNGMGTDFSWDRSAQGYQQLYEWAIARVHG